MKEGDFTQTRHTAYEAVHHAPDQNLSAPEILTTTIEPAYDRYHRMHKVFVGNQGGQELESIYESLRHSALPSHLHTAGWAAVESGMMQTGQSHSTRNLLIEKGIECWLQAIRHQRVIQESTENKPWLTENTAIYRYAFDICHAPLIQALIAGNVTETIKHKVIGEALAIAQSAQVQMNLAERAGDVDAIGDFIGFGHEANALILLNTITDNRAFAIPSSGRAGTGYYYPRQTHDISLIMQHWGDIRKVLPIEVKASASRADRERYEALLLRGKLHLAIGNTRDPQGTLDPLTRHHQGVATKQDMKIIDYAEKNIINLIRLYKRGDRLGRTATSSTLTKFHDKRFVEHMYHGETFQKPL